jgi:hypothetical protein
LSDGGHTPAFGHPAQEEIDGSRWVAAWPEAVAFAGGIGVAWFAGWETRDPAWSLGLAGLVAGCATIV